MATASMGEKPASRADSPYTNPNPRADTAIPSASMSRRRRLSARVASAAGDDAPGAAEPGEGAWTGSVTWEESPVRSGA